MKKFGLALLMGAALISMNSCKKIVGNGPMIIENRSTRDFQEIQFEIAADIRFIHSDHYEVTLEAQRNILDVIETNVSGEELKIKIRNGKNISTSESIRVTVKAPSVRYMSLNGSGYLAVEGVFAPSHGKLRIQGSGKILVDEVDTDKLEVEINGSGNIEVRDGVTDHEDVQVNGSGYIDLVRVDARTAKTHTNGSGTIKVNVSEQLDASISGSGDVLYSGNPTVNSSISGSGRVGRL